MFSCFFSMSPAPPTSTLFPYTTLFRSGVPLPLSRIELALERAGLVTKHVEGLADDYAETLTHWISRFEARYDDAVRLRSEEHTSELQSRGHLVCRLLLEKKKKKTTKHS